jgi:hypothetical protein
MVRLWQPPLTGAEDVAGEEALDWKTFEAEMPQSAAFMRAHNAAVERMLNIAREAGYEV